MEPSPGPGRKTRSLSWPELAKGTRPLRGARPPEMSQCPDEMTGLCPPSPPLLLPSPSFSAGLKPTPPEWRRLQGQLPSEVDQEMEQIPVHRPTPGEPQAVKHPASWAWGLGEGNDTWGLRCGPCFQGQNRWSGVKDQGNCLRNKGLPFTLQLLPLPERFLTCWSVLTGEGQEGATRHSSRTGLCL